MILKELLKKDLYFSIPRDDYKDRQKYILFIVFSINIFLSGVFVYIFCREVFDIPGPLLMTLPCLSVLTAANYFLLQKHRITRIAYIAVVIMAFAIIHFFTYFFGGIYSSANYYLGVITIIAFMLLGVREGLLAVLLCIAHALWIYYLTDHHLVVINYFAGKTKEVEMDLAFGAIFSSAIIALSCMSLEKSKDFIMNMMRQANLETKKYAFRLERANTELEKVNRELDRFAYIISHDLKAPLRAINSLSEWIEEDLEDNISEEVQANMKLLRKRVVRMESLINGVLEYSKVGRKEENPEQIEVQKLIRDIIFMLAPGENVNITIKEPMPVLYTEKVKLGQVFSNLISNAIKYNDKPQCEIIIDSAKNNDFWEFRICDNGPGIAPEYSEKVFEMFQTLQSRDSYESTGVGLAIVKKIVEESGGRIQVRSEINKGACFIFTLPAWTCEDEKNKSLTSSN